MLFVVAVTLAGATLAAQGRTANPVSGAATLAQARRAAAAGRADESMRLVNALLLKNASHRDAVELKIALQISGGDLKAALETYDAYAKAATHDKGLLGLVATGTLTSLTEDSSPVIRVAALERLAAGIQPAARDILKKTRTGADALEANLATEALARLGDAPARAALIESTRVGHSGSRSSALRALKTIESAEVAAAVLTALSDADPFVRAAAAEVAGWQKTPGATDKLKAAMTEPHTVLRLSAAGAMTRLGDPSGRALAVEALESPLHDVRLMVAGPLAAAGDTTWIDAIRPVLEDPTGLNRVMAAELMMKPEPRLSSELLASAANDPNPIIRAEAGRALAAGTGGLATLRKLLGDSSSQVRVQVAAGLAAGRAGK